jgi:SAM-dependent methyltransferase
VIVKDSENKRGKAGMAGSLVQHHHAKYIDDLPFWRSWTKGKDPILELGCGHGRVTIPLARAGRQIVGLDVDWGNIQFLKSELGGDNEDLWKRIDIIQSDMLHFQVDRVFGSVIVPCNTYSTLTARDRQLLLGNMTMVLQKKGLFIVSVPNPYRIKALHGNLWGIDIDSEPDLETVFTHPETGHPVQVSSRLAATSDGIRWDWLYDQLFPDGRMERSIQSTEHKLCSLGIYQREFREAGFKTIALLGDFDGADFDESAPYLILVGEKNL